VALVTFSGTELERILTNEGNSVVMQHNDLNGLINGQNSACWSLTVNNLYIIKNKISCYVVILVNTFPLSLFSFRLGLVGIRENPY
jgi:hypothetical protein